MKPGIYQLVKPHEVFEQHGGGTIRHEIYWTLCFFPDNSVILYDSEKDHVRPRFKGDFDMKGEITRSTGSEVEFYILNPYTPYKTLYIATIIGDRLHTWSFYEDKPEEVVEDVFKYVGPP